MSGYPDFRKDVTVEEALEANRKLADYPIVPLYLFMMGMPTETPEEFGQSIALAQRLLEENPRAVKTFNIYTPYPGGPFSRVLRAGSPRDEDAGKMPAVQVRVAVLESLL